RSRQSAKSPKSRRPAAAPAPRGRPPAVPHLAARAARQGARPEFAVRQARRAQGAARGQQGLSVAAEPPDRQRIDKWLWHARVVRTRSAAAALAGSGHVRLNRQRIDAASRSVHRGDVVTIALDRSVRVLKVLNFTERRGDADAGRQLYEDLTA